MRDVHPLPGTDLVVDGRRIHVVSHGAGPGLPVLLLHGSPTSSYMWRDVARDLEHRHRTVMPDLVGTGRSERPSSTSEYALDAQARAMLGVLDKLGHDKVAVVGHDLGGGVAVHLTAMAPERVAALVLVDAPLHADVWPVPIALPFLTPVVGELYAAGLRLAPAVAKRVLTTSLGANLPDGAIDHYLAPLLEPGAALGLVRMVRAVDLATVEASWRVVRHAPPPTLVLWGENDRLHGTSYGRRIVAELPGAGWVPIGDGGHLLPDERPERVAEEIAGFLAEVPMAQAAVGQ